MNRRLAIIALLPCVVCLAITPACGKLYVDPVLKGADLDGATVLGTVLHTTKVSKVDLLFMIDNSQSMGDKQEILGAAVPDLINALVQPSCVDATTGSLLGKCTPDPQAGCTCATGTLAFSPVHDMHIGIVTSSLGGRGSDACAEPTPNPVNPMVDTHNNDDGELINRSNPGTSGIEMPIADAAGQGFLAWFPPVSANAGVTTSATVVTSAQTLTTDFSEMIGGVQQYGCGFEAQDEAWYRFLVQPDPYDDVSRDEGQCAGGAASGIIGNTACFVGIDQTILQQRADFLRPDSLLAVIVVSDENSGEVVDPLALNGQAWAYMDSHFPGGPGTAAMGTTACGDTPVMGPNPGPLSSNCTSCGFSDNPAVMADKAAGGNCSMNGGYYSPTADSLNTRGVYDLQRFGVDPRYPVSRYVNGLTQIRVPDQRGEHLNGNYVGTADCTNPVFAADLPTSPTADLCNLALGPRTPSLVFLAAITGVPHQLLQAKAGVDAECSPPNVPPGTAQADCPQKTTLADNDWQLILGANPEGYDFTGIDPHMFVSIGPRPGIPSPSTPGNGTDPINGRDWNTDQADQQYACTFPLPIPRDCTEQTFACDCTHGRCDTCGTNPSCVCPPLCGDGQTAPTTTQILAKVYPSPRELEEVQGLGAQGVASSLCPIHTTDNATGDDPLYGYRPAVSAIVQRLKGAFANQCLPEVLPVDASCGAAQCVVLETLPSGAQSDCASGVTAGLSAPDPSLLAALQAEEHSQWLASGGPDAGVGVDPSTLPTCQLTQLVGEGTSSCSSATPGPPSVVSDFANGSCAAASEAGWCYVTGGAAGVDCGQTVAFSPGANPAPGAVVRLVCP